MDGHHVGMGFADVPKAAHDARGHRDHVQGIHLDFLFAVISPIECPASGHRKEHFHGVVGMECSSLAWIRSDIGDVETFDGGDGNAQVGVLRHSLADHVEDFPLVFGQASVDERFRARQQPLEAGRARKHVLLADGCAFHRPATRYRLVRCQGL